MDRPMKNAPVAKEPDEDDYRADSDMRTLIEAEKIKADKARHRKAVNKARMHADHLRKVTGKSY